ncbi:MAG TPA: hypothetical protein VNS32_28720, partial [Flavisolibacter sp.]|nr:hypothetical protein [Flavisolibacter sp.]
SKLNVNSKDKIYVPRNVIDAIVNGINMFPDVDYMPVNLKSPFCSITATILYKDGDSNNHDRMFNCSVQLIPLLEITQIRMTFEIIHEN